jgi:hypothetical protein
MNNRSDPLRNSRNRYDNSSSMQSPSSPSKSVLNRDFCEVLDRGTIEEVANLLESCGAQPEVKCSSSVSTLKNLTFFSFF